MTDNITLPRAVTEKVRSALSAWVRIYQFEQDIAALAALDAALAEQKPEPDVADLFARFAAKQKPLDADMAAILHANLDSLYITEDALQEGIDAQDRDLWQRRADEELLKEYEKRYGKPEPATVEQVIAAHGPSWSPLPTAHFFTGFRAAERFHGIKTEDSSKFPTGASAAVGDEDRGENARAVHLMRDIRDALRRTDPAWCAVNGVEQISDEELEELIARVEDAVEERDGKAA